MAKHIGQPCKICGSIDRKGEYIMREMMFGLRDRFPYYQCNNCGCLQIAEFPPNIEKYYPSNYYSMVSYEEKELIGINGFLKKVNYRSSVKENGLLGNLIFKIAPSSKLKMLHGLGLKNHSRVLDVGCGNGEKFLYPLAQIGFKNLLGCDPYIQNSIQYRNGLQILKSEISGIESVWDVITYHHAFEHLPDPLENLLHVKRLLAPDGICIIRIPTVSSYAWECYRENWYQVDAPRHYFLHSHESMRYLAQKAELKVTDIKCDSTPAQFSGSEKYVNDIPTSQSQPKGLVNYLKRKMKKMNDQKLTDSLNKDVRGDQAVFYIKHLNA
jgi:SAM-dependent methyltransferase